MKVQRNAALGLLLGACLTLAACSPVGPAVEADQAPQQPAATPAGAVETLPTSVLAETPAQEAATAVVPNQEPSGATTAPSETLPTVEAAPTEAALAQPPAGSSYVPLDAAQCAELQSTVQTTLNAAETAVSRIDAADFQDYISGTTGQGCQIVVTGTGNDFPNFVDVANNLRNALTAQGWVEDPDYGADGPTGTAFAMRQNDLFSLVSVDWTPSESADCPSDRPIIECEFTPEQMLYTISLNFARLQ